MPQVALAQPPHPFFMLKGPVTRDTLESSPRRAALKPLAMLHVHSSTAVHAEGDQTPCNIGNTVTQHYASVPHGTKDAPSDSENAPQQLTHCSIIHEKTTTADAPRTCSFTQASKQASRTTHAAEQSRAYKCRVDHTHAATFPCNQRSTTPHAPTRANANAHAPTKITESVACVNFFR